MYRQRKYAAGCLWLWRQDVQLPCAGRRWLPYRPSLLQDRRRWDIIPLQIQLKAPCAVMAHAVLCARERHLRILDAGGVPNACSVPDALRGHCQHGSACAAPPMGLV